MIRLVDVCKSYREGPVVNQVLNGVTAEIDDGELVALMGSSGSGKTTLLNVIGALDQDYEGEITIGGATLKSLKDKALSRFRNHTVGYVFQHFHLLPHLQVAHNVSMASWFHPERGRRELRDQALEALEKVGLKHKADAPANHLSGGEKQRVAIARAIFNQPSLLLADEPTGALDTATGDNVLALFRELNRKEGLTVLIVTHNPQVAERCDRTIHIQDGRIVDAADVTSAEGAS